MFLFSKDKQSAQMLNLLCASDFIFNPRNIQKLNFMSVDLMVLRNMFPPSQLQKR